MLRSFIVITLLAISVSTVSAQRRQPADALRTCVADNTSGKDRKDLAKWIFLAMAAHPEMRQHSSASVATAADEVSRKMGGLVTRLLTVSCVNETNAVMKTGQGSEAMELAFQDLGALAMKELMTDESVQESLALFERYIDQTRIAKATLGN